jgi:hypothetical protein
MEYHFSFLFFFVFCIFFLANGWPLKSRAQYAQHDSRNVTIIKLGKSLFFFFLATMDEHGDMSIQEGVDLRVAAGVKRGAYYLHLLS